MAVEGQFGLKTESAWGTAVTVDKFLAGWVGGNVAREQPPLISKGHRTGRLTPTCLSTGGKIVQGPLNLELYTAPLATLLRHMFGTVATTGSGPYTHTATPAKLDGKSFTGQWGIVDEGGTVRAITASGCKLPDWTLKSDVGEIATLSANISGKDYVTATALASASYLTDCPFTFIHGGVSIAGSSVASVKSFELSSKRNLRVAQAQGSPLIREQLEMGQAGQPPYSIAVETYFESLTLHDLANTAVAVVLSFSDGTNSLTVTTNAWVEASTPKDDGGTDLPSFSFKATPYGTSDAAAITAVLVNGESSSA